MCLLPAPLSWVTVNVVFAPLVVISVPPAIVNTACPVLSIAVPESSPVNTTPVISPEPLPLPDS